MPPVRLALDTVFNVLLYPVQHLHPLAGIALLSTITGFVVLLGYRFASQPLRIKAAKNAVKADILAMRLYRDFAWVMLSSFAKSLYHTGRYLLFNLLPVLVVSPLLALIFMQLDQRYGMRPFAPGEPIPVKITLAAPPATDWEQTNVTLAGDADIVPLMRPVRIPALNEIDWKLQAAKPGPRLLRLTFQDRTYTKTLAIGAYETRLSSHARAQGDFLYWFASAEPVLNPPGTLSGIEVVYPGRAIWIGSFSCHWLWYYFIITLIPIALFKKTLHIEF